MTKPVPGLPIEQQPIAPLCRMVLYGEARNQSVVGQLAILNVIFTLAKEKNATARDIILHPKRFSSLNQDDPNRGLLLTACDRDRPAWIVADAVCSLFEANVTLDPSRGANHYYNPAVAQPKWGRGDPAWQELAVIGDHVFGRCP
jgi:spore germination cell wall hydrolase CwlJ-like protein